MPKKIFFKSISQLITERGSQAKRRLERLFIEVSEEEALVFPIREMVGPGFTTSFRVSLSRSQCMGPSQAINITP
jgi:hypothetical protein